MPRIATTDLASHRDWRRSQLIEAAASLALESGGSAITVAAVASRAGLSRTSVYEYFASSADLAADLVIEELAAFAHALASATSEETTPLGSIEKWIQTSLEYIADGRHLLAKALNAIDLPRERAGQIGAAHRQLLAPLRAQLQAIGIQDCDAALTLIQSVTDSASKRIESGNDAESVISSTTDFCIAGLQALVK